MNWAYIAGFMDGEGSISFQQSSATFSITATIAQSGTDGKKLLEEIRAFINCHEIRSSILLHRQKKPLGKKPMYQLRMAQRESVKRFLLNMMPYLRIKKVKAQDALRTMILFPSMRPDGGWRKRRENLAISRNNANPVSN